MGSTNKTTNYGLSQFIASDKPAWLVDYNGDMEKIDEGMEENKQSAEGNSTKITQIETNLEQVTQTVQNQGTTLQEYSATLTQHGTLINQNSQNISTIQGAVDVLENEIDERNNDIWIFIAGSDGIGIKDGTWKTSWIGYAMEYINRPDTRVIVLTNNGAGMAQSGVNGNNFLGMLKNAGISAKERVSRIYIGNSLADNMGMNNYINYWLNFMSYCRTNYPNAKVEFLDYYYNFTYTTDMAKYNNFLTFKSNLGSTGIGCHSSFANRVFNMPWFNGEAYTDVGQHDIGKKIANYLITGSWDNAMPPIRALTGDIIVPKAGITIQNGSTTSFSGAYNGKNLESSLFVYLTFNTNVRLAGEVEIGTLNFPYYSGIYLAKGRVNVNNTDHLVSIFMKENRTVAIGIFGGESIAENTGANLTTFSAIVDRV